MTRKMGLGPAGYLAPLLAAAFLLWLAAPVSADEEAGEETIKIVASSVISEFPEGIRFRVEASGEHEITSIAVRLRIGQQTSDVYDYLCEVSGGVSGADWRCNDLEVGKLVDGELFWRTFVGGKYIPPGTIIKYSFEIEDSEGTVLKTEQQDFIFYDARFTWEEVSDGPVTVAYHGPVKTRAGIVLDATVQTLEKMGPLLGGGTEEPIRVTMYNNVKEMLEALPPRSARISRELITEGQAFTDVGTLLVLGGGRQAKGTASHEVTHIIVHRAGDSIFRRVPPWLNEGLAEYGNIDPGFSHEIALDFAVATDRLLPITLMNAMPASPEDVIIFYGQGRSMVMFMVSRFGVDKMGELMAEMKNGKRTEDAIQAVYGIDIQELDDMWRDSVGAPHYVPPELGGVRPTAVPGRVILPYSLTPQPGSETIGDKSDEPTPTPEPEPTATPTPAPTSTPVPASPTPAAAAAPAPGGPETRAPVEGEAAPPPAAGTGCGAPIHGVDAPVDAVAAGLLFGLVGLGVRRRRRRGKG